MLICSSEFNQALSINTYDGLLTFLIQSMSALMIMARLRRVFNVATSNVVGSKLKKNSWYGGTTHGGIWPCKNATTCESPNGKSGCQFLWMPPSKRKLFAKSYVSVGKWTNELEENTTYATFQPSACSIISFAISIVVALVDDDKVFYGEMALGSAFLSTAGASFLVANFFRPASF